MTQSEKFAEAYLPLVKKGLMDLYEREEKEEDFLNQKDFKTCEDRARAGVYIAVEPVVKTMGLNIVNSREAKYGEDHSVEKAVLSASEETDLAVGTMSWWNES